MGRRSGQVPLVVAAATLILLGCTGSPPPVESTGPAPSAQAPLLLDLSAGVPIPGHGTSPVSDLHIVDATGYRSFSTDPGDPSGDMVERIELATGRPTWQTSLANTVGDVANPVQPPTVWLGHDGSAVHALRSGNSVDGSSLLAVSDLAAKTGIVVGVTALDAPRWQASAGGLPPVVLDEDASTLVLSADPEIGIGTAVLSMPDQQIAWQNDLQPYVADEDVVLVRTASKAKSVGMAGLDRRTGEQLWELADDVRNYSYLGQTDVAFLVDEAGPDAHRLLWVDPATGEVRTSTADVQSPEEVLDCQLAATVIACREDDQGRRLSGYDLTSGEQLWSITDGDQQVPTLATTYRDQLYGTLPGGEGVGVVLDARSAGELARDVEIPDILFSNDAGALVGTAAGQAWVPATG